MNRMPASVLSSRASPETTLTLLFRRPATIPLRDIDVDSKSPTFAPPSQQRIHPSYTDLRRNSTHFLQQAKLGPLAIQKDTFRLNRYVAILCEKTKRG